MTADDEFRKVAEDLRGLARSLRHEFKAAKWEAKAAARDARRAWRWDAWQGYPPRPPGPPPRWWEQPGWDQGQRTGEGEGAAQGPSQHAGMGPVGAPGTQPPPPGGPPPGWGPPWAGRQWPWGPYQRPPGGTVVAAPPPPPPKPAPPPPPPPAPVRHKRDSSTLISLLLVLVGLAWLGSASGVVSLSLETVLAAVLVVLGAAMVVTARTDWSLSRRHWPVWLGIAVLVLVMASAGQGGLSRLHFGAISASPAVGELGTPVTNVAGPITVNLPTQAPPKDVTLHVHDVFGPVSVVVPQNPPYQVRVDAHARFGPLNLPGVSSRRNVFDHRVTTIGSGARVVTVEISDVFGPVSVTQQQGP